MNLPEGFQVEIKPPEGFKVVSPKIDETKFQSDYKAYAEKSGLDTDPDNPKHFYDYRALYKDEGGFYPDEAGHLSSKYKLDGHPRMFVNGVNTKTGVPKGFTSEMPPAQLPDVARITRPAKEIDEINPIYFSTKEQLKYTYERLFSALFEKPLYAITELGLRGAKGVVQAGGKMPQLPAPKFVEDLDNSMREKAVGWLDKTINIYEHPEKYAPYTFEAETKRANYRAAWYQKSLAAGIGSDVIEACTDLGALMIQMSLMGKVVPTKTATAHIAKVGAHGFFTTSGDVQERAKAAMYRIAYNITPYVANATGATGFGAVATDTALNTFLTSPTYVQAYKQAGGFNDEFLSMVIPQLVMDIGMAWNTRGLPANQAKVKIDRYLANRPEATKLPKDEGVELIKDIQKAIVPKEEVKPEAKPQPLIEEAKKYKSAEEFVESYKGKLDVLGEPRVGKDEYRAETLRFLLDDVNSDMMKARIGTEKIVKTIENVDKTRGQYGGGRYLYKNKDGEYVGALNYTGTKQKGYVLSNIYTEPSSRKKGIASKLLDLAKKDMPNIKVDASLTKMGGDFFKIKTTAQLTDIWKKANKVAKVETKPSKVAESIAKKAIEKKLADTFEGIAQYTPKVMKEQLAEMDKLIKNDIEQAKRIVKGEEALPKGMLGGIAIKSMEDYAVKVGDVELLKDIAESPLTAETSIHAQELRALAERNPESPVSAISKVAKARESVFTKKTKVKSIKEAQKAEVKKIKESVNKQIPTKEVWGNFIKSLQC